MSVCVMRGADRSAAGAVRRATFSLHCRQRRHRKDDGLEVAAQSQPEHEEEADIDRSQPEGCDQQWAVWNHQPLHARVEGRYVASIYCSPNVSYDTIR